MAVKVAANIKAKSGESNDLNHMQIKFTSHTYQ